MAEKKIEKIKPVIIDGFEINSPSVTYQKLQEFTLVLYEKLLNYRKEKNFLMLDRDKWRTTLQNLQHEIRVARTTSFNKEEELEQAKEKHRKDLKEIEQEVKYIYYEHDINLAELKLKNNISLEEAKGKCLEEEFELLKLKRELKVKLNEQEIKNGEELLTIKKQLDEEIDGIKIEQEEKYIENEIAFKKKLNDTIDQLTLKHEMEMSEVEERKNTHLAQMKNIHKSRTEEMKNYFNSITAENLVVISNLKQSLESIKKNKGIMSEEVKKLKIENKMLQEPLTKSRIEVKNLTRQLINYEKDLLSLRNNKRMLKKTLEKTAAIKNESSLALRKIKMNKQDQINEFIDTELFNSMLVFRKEAALKKEKLEENIKYFIKELRKKQQMIQQLSHDPDIQEALKELKYEVWAPRELSYELSVICKAHDDLLQALWGKLKEFCVPETELKFNMLNETPSFKIPCSLVSKQ